jgi:hypothetical protein
VNHPRDAEGEMPADQTGGSIIGGSPPHRRKVKGSVSGDFGENMETEWNDYGDEPWMDGKG